jgi:MULE transposase domain
MMDRLRIGGEQVSSAQTIKGCLYKDVYFYHPSIVTGAYAQPRCHTADCFLKFTPGEKKMSVASTSSSTSDERAENIQTRRRRPTWTTEKSVHPSDLEAELEEFGPLKKCETKCDKTYYRCPLRKRFACAMVIRTVREVATGYIAIETCASSHSHNESNERFRRGLSHAVKEGIHEITKFNHGMRPKALQRALITAPFNFSTSMVDITKISSYLQRIRRATKSSYAEHTVSGLWSAVNSRQFENCSSDWANYFYTVTADMAILGVGSSDARVQIFATTRSLLERVRKISHTSGVMQVVLDSKHRVLMNNYPITALGILDAGQQFNLLALAVSNKEDEVFYTSFLQSIQTQVQALGIVWSVECTMSDNCDAIQNAFQCCFPTSKRGNCNFHIHQNIKKKRSLWEVTVPSTMSARQKSAFVQRARNDRERFAQDSIRWLSSLQNLDDFTLGSKLFLEILRSQGDQAFFDSLSKEYFEENKRGWARAFITRGSATTNNALESFNGNVLARDIAAGSRMTIAQLFTELDGVFRMESATPEPPVTAIDIRECISAKPHMRTRVKEWYAKAVELRDELEESPIPLYEADGHGGFYLLSSSCARRGLRIDNVLASRHDANSRYDAASARARSTLEACVNRGVQNGSLGYDLICDVMKNLRVAIDMRDLSFYHVSWLEPAQNSKLICATAEAERLAEDATADVAERAKACESLSSGRFLHFGVLSHDCTCPDFWIYSVCKHSLWATMKTSGEGPPLHVDPRALATRRRGGRPRGAGSALQLLPPAQKPFI